ncbi:hypothetical protein XH92_17280 [Bradyrhizobium sp. CCBAU 53421]|nr:hypothetical protein XH92_17280 [Bradyrhizobium sp. CCBAU 53421]
MTYGINLALPASPILATETNTQLLSNIGARGLDNLSTTQSSNATTQTAVTTTTANDYVSQDFNALQESVSVTTASSDTGSVGSQSGSTVSDVINTYSNASFSYGGFGDDFSFGPVVLDLSGKGVNITQLSSSNMFFDVTGSGIENQTAWAGAGSGVLFYDPTGAGQLTQANQVIFTDWDPSATSDMQALLDVFDTNHDGSLDSGDTNFGKFFVTVTNADGTQSVQSLASLGITSINLNADASSVSLPDGSAITGETTYTTSSGTTRAAATVSLAADTSGYVVTTTTTSNADGSTTIDNSASNTDGSLDHQRILNTLISSSTSSGVTTTATDKVLTTVNNGGVVVTLQVDNTVASTNGVTTETVTNYSAGTITSTGELTGAGTSGSEKLNSTTTTTTVTSGGTTVTILRDQLGGGWTTQQEVDSTTSTGGPASYVVSNLNPDGSVSDVTSTSVTNGGFTRTVTDLIDGNSALSTTTVDSTVVGSGGTRTETIVASAGTTVTSSVQIVTVTTSNTVTRTTASDLTDGVTLDRTSVAQTVTSSSGSTITQSDSSANGALLDQTITTETPQSSGGLVTSATSSILDNGAFVVSGTEITTISNAGPTQTTTVVNKSADGTLQSESITSTALGSAAKTVTTYATGDGKVSQYEAVTVSGGTTTDTLESLNGDGSMNTEAVTITTSGGLAKTSESDNTGLTSGSAALFDHITTDNTVTSGGTSTETITGYGASTSYKIDEKQIVVTSGGLETIVLSAFTSNSLAGSGTWDRVTTDLITINNGGSVTETTTTTDGAGHILQTVQKNSSANRQNTTTTTTLGTTGLVKQVETVTIESNGTVQDQTVSFDQQGDVLGATVTTTTADGLTRTVQHDVQGQTATAYSSSGLSFDVQTTDTTVINGDGSRAETVNKTSRNGTLLATTTTSSSANGLSITTNANPYATAHYATKTTNTTTLNADGSSTVTAAEYNYNQGLIESSQTVTSAGGLATTVNHDLNGDGVIDQATTDVKTINADGSRTETVTDYTGSAGGVVRDVTTTQSGIIVAGAGLETVVTRQSNGSVSTYQVETILPNAHGVISDTTNYYSSLGGPLLLSTTVTSSANGLSKTKATAVNGDTTTDFQTNDTIVLNADGSQTETVITANRNGLIDERVTTTSANGLSKTTQVDANGAPINLVGPASPVFNLVTTDNTVLNASDGSHTETVTDTNTNGTVFEQTVTTTSADQQSVVTNRYLNETGAISGLDQVETTQTQADGSTIDVTSSYGPTAALVGSVVKTSSGNGLIGTTTFRNGVGATVDIQSNTTTYDANGDGGTLNDLEDADAVNSTTTLTSSVETQTSGNGQAKTTIIALTGALSSSISSNIVAVANASTAISDAGVTTQTTADVIEGVTTDTITTVTSANRLSQTTSTILAGDLSAFIVQQSTTALDGSQSRITSYYDPAATSLLLEQTAINISYDGRTTTTTRQTAYDQLNQSIINDTSNDPGDTGTYTPTFSTAYNVETDTYVENADGSTTETLSGTGSFGAPAFQQVETVATNADASKTTTVQDYDGVGVLGRQAAAEISANGLVQGFAFSTTGQDSAANLKLAAAELVNGTAVLPALVGGDIIGVDSTTLNADGSKTELIETGYGNSLGNLRSKTVITTSANGLVTTTDVDNDGNGIYEQIDTTTKAPDGSSVSVYDYYGDTSATSSTLTGSNTYTTSANGLISTLTTSTGITDTKVEFANSNGSYEWSRNVTAGSAAATYGWVNGSSIHSVDANGIDTWSFLDGYGDPLTTVKIDITTEKQDIAIANELFQTILGHPMDDSETEFFGQYIKNGVFDREQQAYDIVADSQEYSDNYGVKFTVNGQAGVLYQGFDISAAFENALGRLPTAEEMATFGAYLTVPNSAGNPENFDDLATMVVALAQYATDLGGNDNRTQSDPDAHLVSTAPSWISPASSAVQIGTAGTYSYSSTFIIDLNATTAKGVAATINGSNDIIIAGMNSSLTVSGFNNSIDDSNGTATIATSNASILIESGGIATISGNNNQIAQVGPTQVTLTSGTGDVIYVGAGDAVPNPNYAASYSSTTASNASITLGSGIGTSAAHDQVSGSGDSVTLTGSDIIDISGSGDAINVLGSGDTISVSGATISVAGGLSDVVINGNNDVVTIAAGSIVQLTGSSDSVTLGNSDTVRLSTSSVITSRGSNDTVTVSNSPAVGGPVETVANLTATHGQSFAGSSLFSYSDPVGSAATQYSVWDTGAGGGYFMLNGVALPINQGNIITAAQLSQLTYQSGSGADTLWVRANDGWAWGAWSSSFTVTAPTDTGPVETVGNLGATHGQSFAGSSLFTYSDPFGSPATQYTVYNNGTGGGYFTLNGVALPVGQGNVITAAQLSQLTYQSGSGTDTLWVRANDGTVLGAWSNSFTVTPPTDTGPQVLVSSYAVAHGQIMTPSSLFTYSDPFGSAATLYDVWDTGGGGAHFELDGVALPVNQENIITAAQLSQLTYQIGSGADTLQVRANDGTVWGAWSSKGTMTGPTDSGPVETVANVTATHGQSFAGSSLFTYSDPFGSAATQYDVFDTGSGGGHFALNGVALALNQDNIITAAQLSQLTYQSGSGADTLWVRANDGTVWGAWSNKITVTAPTDAGPVETVANLTVAHGQALSPSSLFTYSDPLGSAATQYDVWDTGAGGGQFMLNGTALPTNQGNIITAAQLSQLTYQSGSGADTLSVRANDGTVWGAWSNNFTVTAPTDAGPVETVANVTATHGQSFAGSSLFTYSDPFGSPATQYRVWNTGTGGGHFVLNGVALAANQTATITAAQLAELTYQSGSGADTLQVRAYDGTVWGAWSNTFTVTAPNDAGPVETVANIKTTSGQVFSASSLFTYSDPFSSAATQYDVYDTGSGGGHFTLNGATLGANQDNIVTAAQLSQVTYVAGPGTDTLWVRANDGTVWGAWSNSFTVSDPTTIGADETLELASASSAAISFKAATGTLKLDNSASFSGTVAGLTGQDGIDFSDIAFGSIQTPSFHGTASGGSLSVTDGTHAASIALLGNYMASTFATSSDGHGGTLVTQASTINPMQIASPQHA